MRFVKEWTKALVENIFGKVKKKQKKSKTKKLVKKRISAKGKVIKKKVGHKKLSKKGVKKKVVRKKITKKKASLKKTPANTNIPTNEKKVIKAKPKSKKKTSKKAATSRTKAAPKSNAKAKEDSLQEIGTITHYFSNVKVGVIEIGGGELRLGDLIVFRGATTSFKQKLESMQLNRKPIDLARPGDDIGVRTQKRVRAGDLVYKQI